MSPSESPTTLAGGWFALPGVSAMLAEEQAELIPTLTAQIGVRGLYLRPAASLPRELSGNMLRALTVLHPCEEGWDGDLRCGGDTLPLGSESFSLVYLLHVVEQRADPLPLLRECVRCLQPEGLLVSVVFNPWSPFRLRWPAAGLQPCGGARLERLLRDSGLSIEQRCRVGGLFSAGTAAGRERAGSGRLRALGAPLRASHAVVARKRRAAPTLVGPAGARLRARATPW